MQRKLSRTVLFDQEFRFADKAGTATPDSTADSDGGQNSDWQMAGVDYFR